MMFKAFFKPVALAALLALSATPAAAGDLEISGAWLRAVPYALPPPPEPALRALSLSLP